MALSTSFVQWGISSVSGLDFIVLSGAGTVCIYIRLTEKNVKNMHRFLLKHFLIEICAYS